MKTVESNVSLGLYVPIFVILELVLSSFHFLFSFDMLFGWFQDLSVEDYNVAWCCYERRTLFVL